jgi:hypothetical protein
MNEALHAFLTNLFNSSELNRLPGMYGVGRISAQPLIGVSQGYERSFRQQLPGSFLQQLPAFKAAFSHRANPGRF